MNEKIKVLLVDDEKLERVLISRGFPWEENGFSIIGEAESGEQALEYMRHKRPDLVVTDINMPNINGLELAEEIKAQYPECFLIIVTGYREFEYARKAIKIGVEDFLLKPVNMSDVERVVTAVREKILKQRIQLREEHEVQELKEHLSREQDVLRESFLQRLTENRIEEEKAIGKLKVYGCEALLENACCINVSLREDPEDTQLEQHHRVLEFIRENQSDRMCSFLHYMHNIIVYYMGGSQRTASEFGKKIMAYIDRENLDGTVGISGMHQWQGCSGISESYRESEKALSASVLLGRNRVISYQEYKTMMEKNETAGVFPWDEFAFALENRMENKIEMMLANYIDILRHNKSTDLEYIRLMTMNILAKAGNVLNPYGVSLFQIMGEENLFRQIGQIRTLGEGERLISECIRELQRFLDSKNSKPGNRTIDEALQFVNENLFLPELSLKLVAEKVYSNESYLSRVFKKVIGESLTEYVTRKRVEEGMRLLKSTDLKVYEVAERTGFRDAHYFSICFKKHVGKTVKEFRSERLQEIGV